ncbi:hypothetical protein [Butyrivibrio sp. XPD2002]|uniref:hypothetical protein n=1 Tax=Butyrivibrio sp. XPD2002 TaxID=1280665 RepID=UPI00042A67D9|nr:hypothetical protein [Butyrivibrio sp. XPD2002]
MDYYWTEGKKEHKLFSKFLDDNNIDYSLKIESMIIKDQAMPNYHKKVYIYLVSPSEKCKVERLLTDFRDKIKSDNYISGKITIIDKKKKDTLFGEDIKKICNAIKAVILAIPLVWITLELIRICPVEFRNPICFFVTLICWLLYFKLKKRVYKPRMIFLYTLNSALMLYVLMSSIHNIITRLQLFPPTIIGFPLSWLIPKAAKSLPAIIIVVQGTFLLYLSYKGLERYKKNKNIIKWEFSAAILMSYFVLVFSVISIFTELFDESYSDFNSYAKVLAYSEVPSGGNNNNATILDEDIPLSEKYDQVTITVKRDENNIKIIDIQDENSRTEICGTYGQNEYGYRELYPKEIYVSNYNHENIPISSINLKNSINEQTGEKTSNIWTNEHFYLSTVTYFGAAYGDIYPVSNTAKSYALQEIFISHCMGLFFVPIILLILQVFWGKPDVL